jgi:hypothetical protein
MDTIRYELATPAIIHELLGDEVIIISFADGDYHSLRGTAAHIWGDLVLGLDTEAIIADVGQSFDTTGHDVGADVRAFLTTLSDRGLIRPASDPARLAPATSAPQNGAPMEYDVPTCETFTEMRELMLLDPVHEVDPSLGWPRPAPGA